MDLVMFNDEVSIRVVRSMNLNIAIVKQRNILFYIRLLCTEEVKGSIQSIFKRNGISWISYRFYYRWITVESKLQSRLQLDPDTRIIPFRQVRSLSGFP